MRFRIVRIILTLFVAFACAARGQSNRTQDGRTRESRALEQDATPMWLLKELDEGNSNTRLLEIPWQRNGESRIDFALTFLGDVARIENFAREEDAPAASAQAGTR